jgi:hypothetical protein
VAQALIKINGVAGSNDDLPINTIVQLDNQNAGGEITYNWFILDQPEGSADALSSSTIQNPTFTPKKEGTYELLLVVNQSMATEVRDQQLVGIRYLKTRERAPGATETTQDDATKGWAKAANRMWSRLDNTIAQPGLIVGQAGVGGLVPGDVLRISGTAVIKTGLPGQETVPVLTKAPANVAGNVDEYLYIVVSGIDGSLVPANGALIYARWMGLYFGLTGSPAVGASVYVSDTATISTAPGTNSRRIGHVVQASAGMYDVWIEGFGIGT